MKKLLLVGIGLLLLGVGMAQSGLGISGTVFAVVGGNLQNTTVIACLLENGDCSESGSAYVQISGGASTKFTLPNLKKVGYLVLAWRDLNKNQEPDNGDELSVFGQGGKAVLVTPPTQGLELRLTKFSGDLDALLNNASQPAPTAKTPAKTDPTLLATPATPAPAANKPALSFSTNGWTDNQDGSYSLEYDQRPNNPTGFLEMVVLPPRAKQGGLIAQAMSIWKEMSRGKFDEAGKEPARFVRRLPSGINAAICFGSLRSLELENGTTFENKKFFITVLVLAETGNLVTPIFMVATRVGSSGYSGVEAGLPIMENLVRSIKPLSQVKVPDLYTSADLAGKWNNSSGTYQSGTLVNPSSGAVVGSGYNQTSFQMKLELKSDGTGNYFASLLTNNTGSINTNTENTPMRWRISGDRLTLERPKTGRSGTWVLYGMGKDAKGQPILLTNYIVGNFKGDILTFPDETWYREK